MNSPIAKIGLDTQHKHACSGAACKDTEATNDTEASSEQKLKAQAQSIIDKSGITVEEYQKVASQKKKLKEQIKAFNELNGTEFEIHVHGYKLEVCTEHHHDHKDHSDKHKSMHAAHSHDHAKKKAA